MKASKNCTAIIKSLGVIDKDRLYSAEFNVSELITADLNQNQFDALTAFVYEKGKDFFIATKIPQLVNENKNSEEIGVQLIKYCIHEKKHHTEMFKRRTAEVELYYKPVPKSEKKVIKKAEKKKK